MSQSIKYFTLMLGLKKQPYAEIEPAIKPVVDALNVIPDVSTVASCPEKECWAKRLCGRIWRYGVLRKKLDADLLALAVFLRKQSATLWQSGQIDDGHFKAPHTYQSAGGL